MPKLVYKMGFWSIFHHMYSHSQTIGSQIIYKDAGNQIVLTSV